VSVELIKSRGMQWRGVAHGLGSKTPLGCIYIFFCWFIVGSGAVPLISDLGEFLSCVSRKAKVAQKEKNI